MEEIQQYIMLSSKIYLNQIKPKNVFLMFHDNDNSLIDSTEPIFEFYNSLNSEDYIKKQMINILRVINTKTLI